MRAVHAGDHEGDDAAQGLVVVVGSVNVDQVVRVDRRPGPGETVGGGTLERHSGGKGANQAVAAARCGARVALVGRVGDDAPGRSQRDELSGEGLDLSQLRETAGTPTGLAIVVVTPDGENAIIVVPGANASLCPDDVDAAVPLISRAAVLVVQLEVPMDAVARAVRLAPPGCSVVVNCAPFRALPDRLLARTSVLVANESEAAALAGVPAGTPEAALEAARRITRMGPRHAVVTLGARGAVVTGATAHAHVEARALQTVDTTGAGDAFVGALAAELSRRRAILEALRRGVAVGTATTTRTGARAVVPAGDDPG